MSQSNSKGGRTIFYVILILLLLLVNGVLFYNNLKMKRDQQQVIENLETEKGNLQSEYDEMLEELETYKLEVDQKDSVLLDLESEIEEQKREIERILRSGKATKNELSQARALIESLRSNSDSYKQQIDALTQQNQALKEKNAGLMDTIASKVDNISSLEAEKANLEGEKQNLSEERDMLNSTVNRGQVMQSAAVIGKGVRYKRNGSEVETDKAKKTEKIRVCFDILRNPISPSGKEDLLLRIINPGGEVLSVESMGSGKFILSESQKETKYTTRATINYQGKKENYCMYWEQNSGFLSGDYNAELYNEGYLIGSSSFVLR